jgi:O-antigen ligase
LEYRDKMEENLPAPYDRRWFVFLIIYLIIDYGRPQDVLPIGIIKPGMLVVIILLLFVLFSGRFRFANSAQMTLIWSFIVLLGLHIPFAINNYLAYKTTKDMLLYMPFIISTIILIDRVELLKKLMLVLTVLMIYVSVFSMFRKGVGSGAYFADENDISLYNNTWLPFAYFLFLVEKNKIKKIIYAAGVIIGIIGVVISFSRGGFVGLACVFFIIWLFSPRKVLNLSIILLLAGIMYLSADQAYWTEMSTVTDTNESTATARFYFWDAAWQMFLDHPLGVGGNNFQVLFPEYQSQWFGRDMWGMVAHSLWFTLIPELGIFGIIIYFSLLFINLKDVFYLKRLRKDNEDEDLRYLYYISLAFLGSFAGYFASGSLISVLYYPHYWYLCGILVASKRIMNNILLTDEEAGEELELNSEFKPEYGSAV